jgi:uncharacterized delta-60 repeat protein
MLTSRICVATAVALYLTAAPALAATRPGFLDTRIAYLLGEKINAVGVSAGRILVAGGPQAYPGADSRIRAYLPDGTVDSEFGDSGTAALETEHREVVSMAVDPGGRILVGLTGMPARLQRLGPEGAPDPSFGVGGTLDIDFGGASDFLSDLAIQPDGGILVAGTPSGVSVPEKLIHLRRFFADGAPDPSFAAGGLVELPTGDPYLNDVTLALQPGGRIVLVVRSFGPGPVRIARLSAGGVLDPSFGSGGLANVEFANPRQAARARASQHTDWRPLTLPDGRIRIPYALDVPRVRPYHMAVAGLTANGHPDRAFGRQGLAVARQPELPGGESAEALLRDPSGGLLAAGSLWSGADFTGDEAAVIRRFRRDGTPDRSFGPRGLARGAVPGGGYSVIEQRLAFLDGDTLLAAEHNYDGKYGSWGPAAVRTLNAGYDREAPVISLLTSRCRVLRVRITDLSGLDQVVVRAGRRALRRTTRKRFRVRLPGGTRRASVKATDLAGNVSTRSVRLPRC